MWSLRAYTAEVPLFVQTISKAAAAQIAPFLDRSRDAVLSLEDVRFSLLAFSTVCPGASTLLGNMLRSGSGAAPGALHGDKMAGMRWLRQYVQGSAHRLRLIDCPKSFAGVPFVEAAECLYRRVGAMLIAVKSAPPLSTVLVNPARMMLR